MGVLLIWGPAIFETGATTLDEMREKFGGVWHEHKTIGRMAPGQYLRPRPDRLTIKGVLYPVYQGWSVARTIAALKSASKAGEVYDLITGDGDVFGLFRLEEGERGFSYLLPSGAAQKIEYSAEFVEAADPAGAIWSLWP